MLVRLLSPPPVDVIVVRTWALSSASSAEYRNKGILLDVTHADPQAHYLRNGSATNDGSAARTSEARKRQHDARPGHVSLDERSFKLATLAVESFGRLGEEGYEFIDELAAHAAGGRDGGSMAQKGVFKERRKIPYDGSLVWIAKFQPGDK